MNADARANDAVFGTVFESEVGNVTVAVDTSGCIVLLVPADQATVSNVDALVGALMNARDFASVYADYPWTISRFIAEYAPAGLNLDQIEAVHRAALDWLRSTINLGLWRPGEVYEGEEAPPGEYMFTNRVRDLMLTFDPFHEPGQPA